MNETINFPVKRRIIYVDEKIQRGLLIGLVALEVLLIAATIGIMYLQMSEVIEASLYRVHFTGNHNIYPLLLKTALIGVAGLVVINILVLWFSGWVWSRHVENILKPFRELMGKTESLDFRDEQAQVASHEVIDLAVLWRHFRRSHLVSIRNEISKFDGLEDYSDPGVITETREKLEAIREILVSK